MATDIEIPAALETMGPTHAGEALYDRSSLRGDYMVMIAGQTVEQWWRLAPPNQICEYIDGTIYMPNAPTDEHQDVAGFLFFLLNGCRYDFGMGPVRFGPGVLPLSPDRNPQPDVFVLPPEGRQDVPALLVIEVLSPSTRSHDLGLKSAIYREAAIPELWFIDLEARSLRIDRRGGDGLYTTDHITGGHWAVAALPGFWIDVSWLWARPLPNARRCLEAILAGPPA
jgi:Uma2 family endonuclease